MKVRAPQSWLRTSITVSAALVSLACCLPANAHEAGHLPPGLAETRRSFTYTDAHGMELDISYLDTGGAGESAVVLLHGFGASVYTWKEIIPALAERSRVIAVDLKGFGESDKPDDRNYSVFDQAEMVEALIRHAGLREVILGGHSMGGTIALVLACDPPAERAYRISRLILADVPVFRQRLPLFILLLDLPLIGRIGLELIPPATAVRWVLNESYYDDSLISETEVRAYAAGLSAPGGRQALVRSARALADLNSSGYAFDFDRAGVPALIIWGKKDTVVPPGYAYALRDALPGPVSFHMLERCGHIPPTEKPEETLKIIQEFLIHR
jgi:pimeloyl-ACP methyl ester carboxylesterase